MHSQYPRSSLSRTLLLSTVPCIKLIWAETELKNNVNHLVKMMPRLIEDAVLCSHCTIDKDLLEVLVALFYDSDSVRQVMAEFIKEQNQYTIHFLLTYSNMKEYNTNPWQSFVPLSVDKSSSCLIRKFKSLLSCIDLFRNR